MIKQIYTNAYQKCLIIMEIYFIRHSKSVHVPQNLYSSYYRISVQILPAVIRPSVNLRWKTSFEHLYKNAIMI